MSASPQQWLGEVLVRRGVVPPDRIEQVFETVRERGQPLADVLVSSNVADEAKIAQALAEECGVPFAGRIDIDAIDPAIADRIPITYAKQHKILPVAEDEGAVHC